jgi:glucose-1-phosphate cytidylyltransferase
MTVSIKKKDIPVFILAGGLGTRISEETHLKPKPMIEIGDIPILLHIMRWYYSFGFNDFVICAGYRSWDIKNFFLNYEYRLNHLRIDHRTNVNQPPGVIGKNLEQEQWRVRVIDTGLETMTGARVAKAFDEINQEEPISHFALTYGDGVSDINLDKEVEFHFEHACIGTVLGVPPVARFGELDITTESKVIGFLEKPENRQGLINGGFFLFKKDFRKYLSREDSCVLERTPLSNLAHDKQLMMYKHNGFWLPMDTLRDKVMLQQMWDSGKAPWAVNKRTTR